MSGPTGYTGDSLASDLGNRSAAVTDWEMDHDQDFLGPVVAADCLFTASYKGNCHLDVARIDHVRMPVCAIFMDTLLMGAALGLSNGRFARLDTPHVYVDAKSDGRSSSFLHPFGSTTNLVKCEGINACNTFEFELLQTQTDHV